MLYFVEYNASFIAQYKSINACLKFIKRKKIKDDELNVLNIIDKEGVLYSPINGAPV